MRRRRALRSTWLVLCLVLLAGAARAHILDAATLSLTEVQKGRFLVRLETNSAALSEELRLAPFYPSSCRFDGAYVDCGTAGLAGALSFPWLEGTSTRLMLDVTWLDGRRLLRVLSASAPSLTVY